MYIVKWGNDIYDSIVGSGVRDTRGQSRRTRKFDDLGDALITFLDYDRNPSYDWVTIESDKSAR